MTGGGNVAIEKAMNGSRYIQQVVHNKTNINLLSNA